MIVCHTHLLAECNIRVTEEIFGHEATAHDRGEADRSKEREDLQAKVRESGRVRMGGGERNAEAGGKRWGGTIKRIVGNHFEQNNGT